ncbi:TonB-dependent receptor [Phenylobacterium deserti]|uniref:TonB-dependent receptor n=1 Tax=Phenylobacterium deserti TaxID=1914756 RepID=A0A328A8D3_9CAUL|nr:TonB-dependent receptor [Phenylobacterium deserti]RAK50832.1 TonB-dependent receptor [Phenylobacterium deserti]
MSNFTRKRAFTRNLALALVAGASPLVLASPVLAQDVAAQDGTEIGEVVVTGVRASQMASVDVKRSQTAVVDAISSEDIGKLPDVTIADSLQRVTGIQIKRDAGEGTTVNIRGLSQVITLLNGEQYLSAGNLGQAQPNLADVPSQLMNSVLVFKSTDPRNALSGISGTIDLRTRRPSSMPMGFTASGAAEYQRGEQTKENDYLLNGLVSWRNDRVGVLVSAAGSSANLGNNYSGIAAGGMGGLSGNNDWGGSAPNNFISPHGYESFNRVVQRDRIGVNAAVEFDLGEGFTLLAEGFYAKLDEYNRAVGLNISNRWSGDAFGQWVQPTQSTNTGLSSNGRPWLAVDEYAVDAWWVNSFSVNRTNKSESKNYNLQLNYDNGGALTFEARAIRASAERLSMNGQVQGDLSNWRYGPGRFTLFRDPNDRTRGTFYPANIASQFPASRYTNNIVGSNGGRFVDPNPLGYGENPQLTYNIAGGSPVWSGFDRPISGGLGAGKTLRDYMANLDSYAVGAFSSEGNNEAKSDLSVMRVDVHYQFQDAPLFGLITKVDGGVRRSDRSVNVEQFHLFSNFYGGNGASDPAGCSAQWKAIDVVMNQNQCQAGEMVPDPVTGQMVFQGYTVNAPTRLDKYNNPIFFENFGGITSGLPGVWAADPRDFDDAEAFMNRVFGETTRGIVPGQTFDVDLNESSAYGAATFEWGGLVGDLGLKVIQTEMTVKQNLTGEVRNYGDTNADAGDVVTRRKYTDWLPSLNLVYNYGDNWKFRFAFSRTMQPLDLMNYGGGLSIFTADDPGLGIRIVTGASSAGNPELDPWRSNNYDAAVEYYFGRASMVNVSVFRLDIESFVTSGQTTGRFPDQDGVIRRDVPVSLNVQGEGGTVDGVEIGAKIALSDLIETPFLRNFGVDTNYTFSPSEEERTDLAGDKLPFVDNSKHQYNLIGWYQDDKWQVRVAYNYRTERLNGVMASGLPVFQDSTGYVDVNVSYSLNDNITLYANGSNVTGEIEDYFLRFTDDVHQYAWQNEFESRYTLGVRARW